MADRLPRLRWPAAGLILATVTAAGALAAPALAQTPTVNTGSATTVTTTGALVTVTVNPDGTDTLYQVLYGPTGGPLSSMSGLADAGAGTAPVTETVPITQLTPGTAYTFQAQIIEADNGNTTTDPTTASFTTTANPTGPGTPIIPPQNPATDGLFGFCSTDAQCLADLNGDNALQDGVGPMTLPSNWATLTGSEQIFVGTNLERIALGEAPIPNLVNTYDADVQTGLQNDADPATTLTNNWDSIWAGAFATPLSAIYGWLDNDGPGGANLDCTTATAPGCFGHRDGLLTDPASSIGNPTEMDAGVGTDNNGAVDYAALIVNNPNPTPAANIVFSWTSEQPFLAAPTLGAAKPHGPAPRLSHLTISRSTLTALQGHKRPAVVLDTATDANVGAIVAYTDSIVATATITIERCVVRTHGAKRTATARCTAVGSFTHLDAKGANRFRFTGRNDGAPLKPGDYELSIAATSPSGRHGAAVTQPFTVARSHRRG